MVKACRVSFLGHADTLQRLTFWKQRKHEYSSMINLGPRVPLALLRVVCATAMIAISLWALLLPPLFPYSSHAVVNTKVVTLKSTDEGRISELPPARSTLLKSGARIGVVTRDLAKIQRALKEQELIRQKLQEQQNALDKAIAERQHRLDSATAKVEAARAGALQSLEQARKNTLEKVRIYGDELIEKKARQAQVEPLFKDGIVTASQWSETRQQTIEVEKNLAEAEAELAQIDSRQAIAARGGNSFSNDSVENELNRMNAYEREIAELTIQRMDLNAELGEAENKVALAKSYGESDRSYDLVTPIDGIIWRRQVVNGETIASNQAVADIADANSLFIEAYFRRDFMNSIAIGDVASVYILAESRFVRGRVVDIQVQERNDKDLNTINTMILDSTMLRVNIQLDDNQLKPENIGQLAKVLTSGSKSGWVERSLIWLSLILRSHK